MVFLQSELFRPMEEAFRSGTLAMSDEAVRAGQALGGAWGDDPLNWGLIIASALFFAFNLPNLYRIFPHLAKSFSRWRWHFTIEASLQLARTRDWIAILCIAPCCLVLSRYRIVDMDLFRHVGEAWRTLAVLGLLLAWYLVRSLVYMLLETRFVNPGTFQVARRSERNFFIILTFVLLATVGILYAFGSPDETARRVLYIVIGVVYTVFLVIKGEILGSVCNPLTTFLYLCGLELIPAGILITACLCL
ncbi:MAG: DUF4271 domain-containing protein [Bacteroidales bacterium]|nr:DUF4271 domain-containing protein [Bacteroidales bacterium]